MSDPNTDPNYRVALDVYAGPMDLLLFLIKRDEVDIYDIPISRITKQYVDYVDLLKEIDPEIVSEFLVLAATLMEIKSRTLLPTPPIEDDDEEMIDPRSELVRQLLEYKRFKDAARSLQESAAQHALKHARAPIIPSHDPSEISLDNVDIWNLFEAFNKILTKIGKAGAVHKVTVDDTPIRLHAADIIDSLQRAGGEQRFEEIFSGRSRAEMIGLFLALLELIRRCQIQATQHRALGDIHIRLLDPTPLGEEAESLTEWPDGQPPEKRTVAIETVDATQSPDQRNHGDETPDNIGDTVDTLERAHATAPTATNTTETSHDPGDPDDTNNPE